MKTNLVIITALAALALLASTQTGLAEEQQCYDYKKPKDCPDDQQATPHGGCTTFPVSPQTGTTNNVDSSLPGCVQINGSYCDGYNHGGYCGSDCASMTDPTDLKADGTEQNQVPSTYYSADFWCTDYDTYYEGYGNGQIPIHTDCGPLCLNQQPVSETQATVTDCKLTQNGCPFND